MSTQYLSTPRFVRGKLISLFENVFHMNKSIVRNEHPGYTFIQHTDAINFRSSSSVGIFADSRGKKFFIKDYAYTLRNLDFEYLHNEINTLRILNNESLPHSAVRVPRIIQAEDNNGRITLITEYVEGKTIGHVNDKVIQQVLIDIILYLNNLSFTLPTSSLEEIPKRSQALTFITFPFNLARALLKEPSESILFLKGIILFLRYTPNCLFQEKTYGICHRDLSVDNIIYDKQKKQSIILDTEMMIRADKLYDVALLPRLYIRYLNANQILSIFRTLHLSRPDSQRLVLLMITSCISKIATEQKNARDYINAVHGLKLTVNTLIPVIERQL